MVSRMFRLETEVDTSRRDLLRRRLRDTNTAASPVLRALRGTPGERELPLHVWADGRHRGAGLGSQLLAQAERVARDERGCASVRLETWDFQAPEFYRKQGYDVVCVIPDYPPGITEYTLVKRLR